MTERFVENEYDRKLLLRYLEQKELPFVASVVGGKRRTLLQNKLQRLWCNEISQQLEDSTPEEVRGYIKLHIGIPIRRAESDEFRAMYDGVLKPLGYEQKMALMMVPLDLPVTRDMTSRQKTQFLDEVYKHFTEKGLQLTRPDGQELAA